MNELVEKFRTYFRIDEVLSPACAKKYGEKGYMLFRPDIMRVMIWAREGLGVPFTINNWSTGGSFSQRGYRENTCQIVSDKTKAGVIYCGAHTNGSGFDFDAKGMKAEDVRAWIRANIDYCPVPIRIEKGVSWVHIDTMNITNDKLVEFSA